MADEVMHAGEAQVDVGLVRRLVAEQAPQFAHLPIADGPGEGTVNRLFRLGSDLSVRMPRTASGVASLLREIEWLPRLAEVVTVAVPTPVLQGAPADDYPFPWAVYRWIDGEAVDADAIADQSGMACDLAAFVNELRRADLAGGPLTGREPLAALDSVTREAISPAGDRFDRAAVTAAWDACLDAPVWDGRPVWRHCDLLPGNLLTIDGRLAAVLDWGGAGIGDPAAVCAPAWTVLDATGREAYRLALGLDEGTWARGRGLALHQALLIIPYYAQTNPPFVTMALRTVREVLSDLRIG